MAKPKKTVKKKKNQPVYYNPNVADRFDRRGNRFWGKIPTWRNRLLNVS